MQGAALEADSASEKNGLVHRVSHLAVSACLLQAQVNDLGLGNFNDVKKHVARLLRCEQTFQKILGIVHVFVYQCIAQFAGCNEGIGTGQPACFFGNAMKCG